eukprot:jgi/Tetstr1/424832/TSEL_015335.t1
MFPLLFDFTNDFLKQDGRCLPGQVVYLWMTCFGAHTATIFVALDELLLYISDASRDCAPRLAEAIDKSFRCRVVFLRKLNEIKRVLWVVEVTVASTAKATANVRVDAKLVHCLFGQPEGSGGKEVTGDTDDESEDIEEIDEGAGDPACENTNFRAAPDGCYCRCIIGERINGDREEGECTLRISSMPTSSPATSSMCMSYQGSRPDCVGYVPFGLEAGVRDGASVAEATLLLGAGS